MATYEEKIFNKGALKEEKQIEEETRMSLEEFKELEELLEESREAGGEDHLPMGKYQRILELMFLRTTSLSREEAKERAGLEVKYDEAWREVKEACIGKDMFQCVQHILEVSSNLQKEKDYQRLLELRFGETLSSKDAKELAALEIKSMGLKEHEDDLPKEEFHRLMELRKRRTKRRAEHETELFEEPTGIDEKEGPEKKPMVFLDKKKKKKKFPEKPSEEQEANKQLIEREQRFKELELISDIVKDGKAYLEAAGLIAENLDRPYSTAFKNEDPEGIYRYFLTLQNILECGLPLSVTEAQKVNHRTERRIVAEIIENYENRIQK